MNLQRTLRNYSFPTEDENRQAEKSKLEMAIQQSRKYGQIKMLRKQRHKTKKQVTNPSWKKFKDSDGLKKLKNKPTHTVIIPTIPPREDLVELGKTILRTRRKLMGANPPSKKPMKPKSAFEEKDFKNLHKDLRSIFCS